MHVFADVIKKRLGDDDGPSALCQFAHSVRVYGFCFVRRYSSHTYLNLPGVELIRLTDKFTIYNILLTIIADKSTYTYSKIYGKVCTMISCCYVINLVSLFY